MGRLLLVSNRLPVSLKIERGQVQITRSAGGVATGLKDPHEQSGGLWIGWPGDVTELAPDQRRDADRQLADLRTVPLYLSRAEVSRFYEGFANGVLWPLFHYLIDLIPLDAKGWHAYQRVNQRYAELVAQHYRPGDRIWVHDYQLLLVPGMLRERLPDARIGFFLHIPFPADDLFRVLPWRDEILKGMLGADLVGFHAFSYQSHFAAAALRVLGLESELGRIRYQNREVRVGVFPMGVDAAKLSALAAEPDVIRQAEEIRTQHPDVRMLLGIDRLDYTKGIPRRLMAVERLLEQHRSLRGRVRLIQVTVPSRVKVEAYAAFRKQVDELVGKINGVHSTLTTPPIHYLYRSFAERYVVTMYRAADVMVVTPLRDGMNLVAKEFVATRNDEQGVLVLSEFAGAAAELGEAIQVNPYDIDGVARAIYAALEMPPEERRKRMRALRRRVFEGDVHHWVRTFLAALEEADQPVARGSTKGSIAPGQLVDRLREARPLVLLFDYDGTLVPFASAPELASPDRELLTLLAALAELPDVHVHVLSGRGREVLDGWLWDLPVSVHAEHGFWFREPQGEWAPLREISEDWKAHVRPILETFAQRTPGSLIEENSTALLWHYRMAEAEFGALQARELRAHLSSALVQSGLDVIVGHKVVEVRLQRIHKGMAVSRLLGAMPGFGLLVAVGDDESDEEMFGALPENGIGVRLGSGYSQAAARLPDWRALRSLLRGVLRRTPEHGLRPAGSGGS